MRGPTEIVQLFSGEALTHSNPRTWSKELLVGDFPWYKLVLELEAVVVAGTGTGPIADALLRYMKAVHFRTDRGEELLKNVPGRLLYRIDQRIEGTAGVLDSVTGSGTFRCQLVHHFQDPTNLEPVETIFDSARYKAAYLTVSPGAVADFFGTPGTATVAATLSAYIERQRGVLELPADRPLRFFREVGYFGPVVPSSIAEVELEKASNLAYTRLYTFATENATPGVPFTGDADADALDTLQVEESRGFLQRNLKARVLNGRNKSDYAFETAVTGLHISDFIRDRSTRGAVYAGDKSLLKVKWTNGSLGTNPQVTVGYEGFRPLAA